MAALFGSKEPPGAADTPGSQRKAGRRGVRPGVADYLAGEENDLPPELEPYLPGELIGGSVPYVPGTEHEAVWNAAAQACGTEKVHYVLSIADGRCWYLACPSETMASNPDSWCPLAAALPGNSEHWDRETVYIYEQEGRASALRWDQESGHMQVFLGAARTVLPRVQSMDASFVTIKPEIADPVPWLNRQLRTEKLSRAMVRMIVVTGIAVCLSCLAIMGIQGVILNIMQKDLQQIRMKSDNASLSLMMNASRVLQSDLVRHMVRIQELLDELADIDGTLAKYQVNNGQLEWEAIVPAAYSSGVMSVRGTVQPGVERDGRIRIKGKN